MTALLSVLALLAAWALLANVERIPWPPQRHNAIHDVDYWTTVQRDAAAYMRLHSGVVGETRRNVEAMATTAAQRLGGLTR